MSFIGTITHAGHEISSAAHHVLHGVKSGIHHLENDAGKLTNAAKHELNALKEKVEHLENHLHIAQLLTKTLHTAVHDAEDAGEAFASDIKNLADNVWDHIHDLFHYLLNLANEIKEGEELLDILHKLILEFTDATRTALQTIAGLFEKPEEIVQLIDLDRFKRTFDGIKSVWEHLVHLAEQVPSLLEEAISINQTAKKWLDTAEITGQKQDFADRNSWFQSIDTFAIDFKSMVGQNELPIAINILDVSLSELKDASKLIPDHLWSKMYHALHLEAVYDFMRYAVKAMKSASFKRDMLIALAACKSLLHWVKTIPEVLGLDADFDLIDFLKAKVGAGDASGAAEGGADGDSGGGFNLKFKAFSGSGAFISILMAILNLFVAGGQLAVDEIKA